VSTYYVHPTSGNDSNPGTAAAPFKTLTYALSQAAAGSTLYLSPGTYSASSGERFPIVIPAKIVVSGNEAKKGQGIAIVGSGLANTNDTTQQVTLLPMTDAQLRGVTVTNPVERGTGIWIQSTHPTIANCTIAQCKRDGIRVTGIAKPIVTDNICIQNAAYGIWVVKDAKGEIRGNLCQDTGTGIAVADRAAPLLVGNTTSQNRVGVLLSNNSYAVLRNNAIERNLQDGLVLVGNARVDLGHSQSPGGNLMRENAQYDLQNSTSQALLCAGNQINPTKVKGLVELVAIESAMASGTPIPETPTPTASPSPTPAPPSGLSDIGGHWAAAFIQALLDKGLISGFQDRTFKPEASITRAEYAAIVAKTFNVPLVREAASFTDVPSTFWGYNAIVKANRMGFISGFPDGTFRPAQNLTRVQALLSIVSGLGLQGSYPDDLLGAYSDRAQIPSYATNAVATATGSKLVTNYPQRDRLNPMRDITRAEVVAFVYQALVYRNEAKAIDSPYIVLAEPSSQFSDIANHWAKDFILGLANKGLISGFQDGTFRPDTTMTRAQYAALLATAFDPPVKRSAGNFTDVPTTFWGYEAIQKVYQGEFLSGFSPTTFVPQANIQRLQAIVSLVNGLGLSGGVEAVLLRYADAGELPNWAKSAVVTATHKRLVVNYPTLDRLKPLQDATRAETAAMVYQGLVAVGKLPGILSSYIA
jgi:parallel beta-helix repeat protein